MVQYIETKSILSSLKQKDGMFGISYNMNLYRGCQHGCIYCDTRSECYRVGDISQIRVKKNAPELLRKELTAKKTKGTIGTGSMNDPYMPVEKEIGLTRQALEIIVEKRFPVHIITKSDLVTRDIELIKEISNTYAAVSFTITAADDKVASILEPGAPVSDLRFKAMEKLAKEGIYTGVTLMPLLPFINDSLTNLEILLKKAKESGASYIIPLFGVTLRKGSRDYFYEALAQSYPDLRVQYERTFGDQYFCNTPNYQRLSDLFMDLKEKLHLDSQMKFYTPPQNPQLQLFK